MVDYCVYAIVALLLIYPHSTNQTVFSYNVQQIENDLDEEKPQSGEIQEETPIDIACDKLFEIEKRTLCTDVMRYMVTKDVLTGDRHRDTWVGAFLKQKSKLAVPSLANASYPYACNEIPIERTDIAKRMYWCPHRVYKKDQFDGIGQAEGFFIAGSQKIVDRAYIFRPSPTDCKKVIPVAKMDGVSVFTRVSIRVRGSTSASAEIQEVNTGSGEIV